jgi:hypothetical protein
MDMFNSSRAIGDISSFFAPGWGQQVSLFLRKIDGWAEMMSSFQTFKHYQWGPLAIPFMQDKAPKELKQSILLVVFPRPLCLSR